MKRGDPVLVRGKESAIFWEYDGDFVIVERDHRYRVKYPREEVRPYDRDRICR